MKWIAKAAAALLAAAVLFGSALPVSAVLSPEPLIIPEIPGGDGFFSGEDLLLLKAYAQQSGGITLREFLLNRRQLLKLSPLSLARLAGIAGNQTQILAPGQSLAEDAGAVVLGEGVCREQWQLTAAETGRAVILKDGKLTTAAVCDQPLEICLPETPLLVDPGASADVGAALNYPVNRSLSYTCSDQRIATVDAAGHVTGIAEGVATVTAALPEGQTASREIRVIRQVRSVALSQDTLKIKHNGGHKTLGMTYFPENAAEPLIWSSSDPSIATVDGQGVVTGLSDGYATISCTAKYSGVSASCRVKVCDLIQVALTFDDGPSADYTMQLLDTLRGYGIHATFFMVGNRIYTAEDAVRRMVEDGHELGYHSWSHQFFYNMDEPQIKQDYKVFQAVLESVCGEKATVYRSPGGSVTPVSIQSIPLPHIYWTEDTRDWETRNTEKVKAAILSGLHDGSIILLHDIHATSCAGAAAALEEIFSKDLDVEFLTVSELLSRDGTAPKVRVTYSKG